MKTKFYLVMIQIQIFWFVTPCNIVRGYQSFRDPYCSHHPEDGGSMDLWNFGILPQHHTASQPRRPRRV